MGTLNLTALIGEVRGFHAGRSDLTDEIIITYLNLAQERITVLWDWEELQATKSDALAVTASAANDKFLILPTGWKEIYSFRIISSDGRSKKLEKRSLRQFDKMIPEPEYFARGLPFMYASYGGKAELYKVPDVAYPYIIRYNKWADNFVTSTPNAVSNLDRKDSPLIYLSSSMLMDRLGEYERATRLFGIAKHMVDRAIEEEERKPDTEIKPEFEKGLQYRDQYWNDPFIKKAPI